MTKTSWPGNHSTIPVRVQGLYDELIHLKGNDYSIFVMDLIPMYEINNTRVLYRALYLPNNELKVLEDRRGVSSHQGSLVVYIVVQYPLPKQDSNCH